MTQSFLSRTSPLPVFLFSLAFSVTALSQQTGLHTLPDSPGFVLASAPVLDENRLSAARNDEAEFSSSATFEAAVQNTSQSPTSVSQTSTSQPSNNQASSGQPDASQQGQSKRILGIIPNFRSVNANQHLPPQSVKEKFVTATQDSFDYSAVIVPALLAGYNQARNQTPEFHQGAAGYGRYFWHSFVDQTSENYWVEFIVPAIAHEDTRYYTLGSGGFLKRSGYAIRHVVVTRSDSGKDVFNSGEVVGAAFGAALSNAYYPSPERTFGNTAQQWGTSVGIDAFTFVLREFWPDFNRKFFGGKE